MIKIIITVDVQDETGNTLTNKTVEVFGGEVVAKNVPQQSAQPQMKKKGNFSGAIAAIAKATTQIEINEIERLIGERSWTGSELKTITAALEERKKTIGG